MYHAVPAGLRWLEAADPRYAVTRTAFERQVLPAVERGLRLSSVATLLERGTDDSCVTVTFDDGHARNPWAAERLAASGGTADFFVGSSTIGSRHLLSWAELRHMSDSGMSVQSHGHSHRYFDDLDDADVLDELARSKNLIADEIGRSVSLFALPGGRMSPALLEVAGGLGYAAVRSSRVGIWRGNRTLGEILRAAVLATTPDRQRIQRIEQDPGEFARAHLRQALLRGARCVLGNRWYERLRGPVINWGGDDPGS
jgi:peptidoglycan/xylan/chitin deacetylase (PgdA/CDA1 family)